MRTRYCSLLILSTIAFAAPVPFDVSGVRPGPVAVAQEGDLAIVRWKDGTNRNWEAAFNLEPARPLIAAIKAEYSIFCNTRKERQ